jgi:FkbM family methyltransferase
MGRDRGGDYDVWGADFGVVGGRATRGIPASDPAEAAAAQWAGMSGALAFDVGAHRGENFRHLAGCGATRIVAFEPEPARFAELEQLWLGPAGVPVADPEVTLNASAIAGRAGLLEARRANGMLGRITGDELITVPAITLDDAARWYGTPDIVVVDVEGFEDDVLAGAGDLLGSRRADWLVEYHSRALFGVVALAFERAGYEPEAIRHPHYPPDSGLWWGHGWVKALRP